MSRAFVKEKDGEQPEDLPPLPESPHPNRLTAAGLQRLRLRLEQAHQSRAVAKSVTERALRARDAEWLERRVLGAIVVPAPADRRRIGLGAHVSVEDQHGDLKIWQIVGEDDAAPEQGRISWISPLAQALEGARVGDVVEWSRPAGDLEIVVREVWYED